MSNQRGALNKRDARRKKEEEMDLQLKEIGCWEEGLAWDHKFKIIEFLKESQSNQTKNVPTSSIECEAMNTEESISDRRESFQKDESPEPVIMYDSFTNKALPVTNLSQSSSEEELTIFPKNKECNSNASQHPSCSYAEKNNNVSHDHQSPITRKSFINFDNINKQVEKLNILSTSISETLENSNHSADFTMNGSNPSLVMSPINENNSISKKFLEGKLLIRKNMRNQEQSTVLFKNATETNEECVERILEIFNNHHRRVIAYQKTLTNLIPWGPPVLPGQSRQLSQDLRCRRLRSSNTVSDDKKCENIYNFNISETESSSEEINNVNDGDWIECNKNKNIRQKFILALEQDARSKLPRLKRPHNSPSPDKLDDEKTVIIAEKSKINGTENSFRSIKRKTFTFLKRNDINTNEPPDVEQQSSKKQKIIPDNVTKADNDNEEILLSPSLFIKKGRRVYKKPLTIAQNEKESVEDDHIIPSNSSDNNLVPHSNKDNPIPITAQKAIVCPLCQKEFPLERIEVHASDCMVEGGDLSLIRANSEEDVVYLTKQRTT